MPSLPRSRPIACWLLLAVGGCESEAVPVDTAGPAAGVATEVVATATPAASASGVQGESTTAIEISRATTSITSPLNANGRVDYVAAINQLARVDVSTDNNAAVLFCRAFGPTEIPEDLRGEYFAALGMESLPAEGAYLRPLHAFAEGQRPGSGKVADEQQVRAMEGPWTDQQYPMVAQWLQASQQPIDLLVEATRRPKFYGPLLAPDDAGLGWALFPLAQQSRIAARALASRAMLRLQAGEWDSAQADILACHRLSRLIGQGPSMVHGLVAISIDAIACQADIVLMNSESPSGEQLERYLAELRGLGPLPRLVDKLNAFERYAFLDAVQRIPTHGFDELDIPADIRRQLVPLAGDGVAWNEVLRLGNAWHDRLGTALRASTHVDRRQQVDQLNVELRQLVQSVVTPTRIAAATTPRQRAELVGPILVSVYIGGFAGGNDAETGSQMRIVLSELGLALAAHQQEAGSFPSDLQSLSPRYVSAPPVDLFSGSALRYQAADSACLVYSVGPNGIDDGGRDHSSMPTGDDLVIRIGRQ